MERRNAQKEAQKAITALELTTASPPYSANDENRRRRHRSDEGAGINRKKSPSRSGTRRAGLQRTQRRQFMDGVQGNRPEANIARNRPGACLTGEGKSRKNWRDHAEEVNTASGSPSILLHRSRFTKENVKSTVVADGFVENSETLRKRLRRGVQRSRDLGLSMSPDAPLLQLRGSVSNSARSEHWTGSICRRRRRGSWASSRTTARQVDAGSRRSRNQTARTRATISSKTNEVSINKPRKPWRSEIADQLPGSGALRTTSTSSTTYSRT